MSEQSLILLPTKELVQKFWLPTGDLLAPGAAKTRDELVERSKAIEKVSGASSQQFATDMLGELNPAIKQATETIDRAAKPFGDFYDRIKKVGKDFVAPMSSEKLRLKQALQDYAIAEDRKARQARAQQEAELAKLQAERKAAELATTLAQKPEEVQAAQETILAADLKAAEVVMTAQPIVATKAEGSKTRFYFKVVVNDAAALYRVFPQCVELKPKMREVTNEANRQAETLPEGAVPTLPGCVVTREADVSNR